MSQSSTRRRSSSLLDRTRVVLVEPKSALNVGSVLRACRNLGVRDLVLVSPQYDDPGSIAVTAPGLDAEAAALPQLGSLDEALAGSLVALGFSARPRRVHRLVWSLPELVNELPPRLEGGQGAVSLVFGREDFGLSNEELDRCTAVVHIPTEPDYSSLNLAQAVLLAVWTVRDLAGDERPSPRKEHTLASVEDVEAMMAHAADALRAIDFFKFPGAETTVLRTLRGIWARAQLDEREVRTLRAIFAEIERLA